MLELSKQDAADIVNELSKLINLKINIVDSNAIIIANSDSNRVGDFHEASKHIIDNKLEELIAEKDNQFEGTQGGTNLPIIIDNQIIGVVGITGPVETARNYGQIIKKMTEILIQGKARDIRLAQRKRDKELFEQSYICEGSIKITDAIKERGNSFNIDILHERRIIITQFKDEKNLESNKELLIKYSLIENSKNLAFQYKNTVVIALSRRTDEKIANFLHLINNKIKAHFYAGIDENFISISHINEQYKKAKKALVSCTQKRKGLYSFYKDLNLELIIDDISLTSKKLFFDKIFKNYKNYDEIKKALHLIEILYEENGSIKQVALRLNIHSNTIQYQLKKIESKTGLDPRNMKDVGIFSLALNFQQELYK